MQQASLLTVMVTISGPRIPRQTVKEALSTCGLDNVEVTWRSMETPDGDSNWRITVVTGHKVAVGALPSDRHTARELAVCLNALLHDH